MIFGVLREVLEALDEDGIDNHGEDWEVQVGNALEYLTNCYGNQALLDPNRELIDYSEEPVQAAYTFMYVAGHAEFIYQILCHARDKLNADLFKKSHIKIACLGGGPGSDLLGLSKYIAEREPHVNKVSCKVVDKEGGWDSVAQLVADRIPGINAIVEFVAKDVVEDCRDIDLSDIDALFISFFISEVSATNAGAKIRKGVKQILKTLPARSLLVYNDNKASTFLSFFKVRVSEAGKFMELDELDDVLQCATPDLSGIFQEYMDVYGRTPKLSSKAVAKVYRRVS